jgi:hypothetical protein
VLAKIFYCYLFAALADIVVEIADFFLLTVGLIFSFFILLVSIIFLLTS